MSDKQLLWFRFKKTVRSFSSLLVFLLIWTTTLGITGYTIAYAIENGTGDFLEFFTILLTILISIAAALIPISLVVWVILLIGRYQGRKQERVKQLRKNR